MSLRTDLKKLATAHPELRGHLVPLLKKHGSREGYDHVLKGIEKTHAEGEKAGRAAGSSLTTPRAIDDLEDAWKEVAKIARTGEYKGSDGDGKLTKLHHMLAIYVGQVAFRTGRLRGNILDESF